MKEIIIDEEFRLTHRSHAKAGDMAAVKSAQRQYITRLYWKVCEGLQGD